MLSVEKTLKKQAKLGGFSAFTLLSEVSRHSTGTVGVITDMIDVPIFLSEPIKKTILNQCCRF
jgi:hypothetical protein